MRKISVIAAMSKNNVIGIDNTLPWHISDDLKRFKKLTINHPIIMGRKTFDSIGKPLKDRQNIVISRNRDLTINGVTIVNSLEEAINITSDQPNIFIIGGEQIYEMAMPIATHLYLTEVSLFIDGDAFFPKYRKDEWVVAESVPGKTVDNIDYCFVDLIKKTTRL
ncbi:MAG: dihydrofolate reductase [Methylophilales bacterium]|jgi:dihydrofolate reductase|nr:dihydrofolate reductase [Pseudomonadota bacterium]NQW34852.1 dihydrofolate reductase [Methylophilales bacterium]HCK03264.1 diacylglycerol kinase [Methylophilaceae bacterium]|tara:strand:+ start:34127 stop:34621 length:495 start_codon:yes stop_codon:yes gene_type:complete